MLFRSDVHTQFSTACSPTDTTNSTSPCYSPVNYDGKFRGPMTLRDALAQSINVPAIKVLYLAGLTDTLKLAKAMGITTLLDPDHYGLTLVLALSYGARVEIVEAVRSIAEQVKRGQIDPAEITEQVISQHLYTRHLPDPDLLIRTSGEMRISNFLLWQISYTELVVTPTLWPDFRKPHLCEAIEEYARRHRRFGSV